MPLFRNYIPYTAPDGSQWASRDEYRASLQRKQQEEARRQAEIDAAPKTIEEFAARWLEARRSRMPAPPPPPPAPARSPDERLDLLESATPAALAARIAAAPKTIEGYAQEVARDNARGAALRNERDLARFLAEVDQLVAELGLARVKGHADTERPTAERAALARQLRDSLEAYKTASAELARWRVHYPGTPETCPACGGKGTAVRPDPPEVKRAADDVASLVAAIGQMGWAPKSNKRS